MARGADGVETGGAAVLLRDRREERLGQSPSGGDGLRGILEAAAVAAEGARRHAGALDRQGAFPAEDIAALHRHGLLLAPMPERLGGVGLGAGLAGAEALARVLALVGAGSLPLGRLYEGHVNALQLVLRYGSAAQQRDAAEDAAAGRLFAVWNTDDRAAPLRLEAASEDRLTLRGAKILASGAGHVARPLVTAATAAGPVMLVPRLDGTEPADLAGWTAQGMQASATGRLDFEGLVVAPGDALGAPCDYLREPAFSTGAWRCLAVQSGGMAELLALLRAHLRHTQRDADPHQRARFGEAAIAVQTARLWVAQAAQQSALAREGEGSAAEAIAGVNLARRAVEEGALSLLQLVQRSIGLSAFLRPAPVERVARDLATYLRQPAPDYALDRAAAHLLEHGLPAWH